MEKKIAKAFLDVLIHMNSGIVSQHSLKYRVLVSVLNFQIYGQSLGTGLIHDDIDLF